MFVPRHTLPAAGTAHSLTQGVSWLLLALSLSSGCTALRLQKGTVEQAATVADIQYQQVLDNLARFACNPNSLAWHVKVNGGVVQVADQGAGFAGVNLGGPGEFAPNLGLQRNVLHQWNVDPVIESGDLELLQIAYRKAVNPFDPDGTVRAEAFEQICELSTQFHIVLARDIAMEMIESMHGAAHPERKEKLEAIKGELTKLYDEIDLLSQKSEEFDPDKMCNNGCLVPSRLEFLQEQIIKLTNNICDVPYVPVHSLMRPRRNQGLIEQAQDRIAALVKLVDVPTDGEEPNPFASPWICVGCKKDVPPCACYVGHFKQCGCECYVWIMPDAAKTLRDFTLIVLDLAPPSEQDMAAPQSGLGAANSPGF